MFKRVVTVALAIALLSVAGCAELRNLRKQNASLNEQVASLEADKASLLEENGVLEATAEGLRAELDKTKNSLNAASQDLEGIRRAEEDARREAVKLRGLLATLEGVGVDERPDGIFVRFDSDILFAPGKDELSPEASVALDRLMEYLQTKPDQKIRIDGHTDGVPISRSGWKDNYHLGAMRALAVMQYLTSKGLDPSRAFIAGFGPNQPKVEPPEPTADVPENRRVEVFLVPKQAARTAAERISRLGQ
jgi:chemotaxis protein MotB